MIILLLLFAYLLGSVPTGVILARLSGGADPRTRGSGNIGATNIYRIAGKKLGLLTLICDIAKGVAPVVIAREVPIPPVWVAAVALAVFLGHIHSIFLKFSGGKGIATALGAFLALSPAPAVMAFFVFLAFVYRWRYISLGSLAATAAFPLFLALMDPQRIHLPFAIVIGIVIFYRHRLNIRRLWAGTESKFGRTGAASISPVEPPTG
ncbi:MAG: glycerol-3-phosphate 1-O-acyltransferase PlsY [Deltaproteobacteria bacterium]|nr:glycerol-3-phosphate 1-O-acyltransferase PlsY [Deltaproteobacteria bacterium]